MAIASLLLVLTLVAWKLSRQSRGRWLLQHFRLSLNAPSQVDLLLAGDSITRGWNDVGEPVLNRRFGGLTTYNIGIAGDSSRGLLTRLRWGQLAKVRPCAVMVMIGSNDIPTVADEEIVENTSRILELFGSRFPSTRIVLMGIPPRDAEGSSARAKIARVNSALAEVCRARNITFLDLGPALTRDRNLASKIMPDSLHLGEMGYEIWAETVLPVLKQTGCSH